MIPEKLAGNRCFGGEQQRWTHRSAVLDCDMTFAVYLPPQAGRDVRLPVVYWLSGLTCTDENFTQKAGAQRVAAELGLVLVAPDTSPRGDDVPDDPDGAYDLGLGAGFYVNATRPPWSAHYRMYDYVTEELPALIESAFPVSERRAISGHSMGGHGALVAGLRNPERYASISAFSPIANPVACPWGQKAFMAYLGEDRDTWREYDATELLSATGSQRPILVDQGEVDNFLEEQLLPGSLRAAAAQRQAPLELRMQPGYDHSYFFIASFIEDHLRFHARHLAGQK